jgi:hypothetical protein
MAPEALARTLRAVAAELERDPALARRIAEALAAPTPDPSPTGEPAGSAGNLTPGPAPARRGESAPPLSLSPDEKGGASSTSSNSGNQGTARAHLSRRSEGGAGVGAASVNHSFRPRLITGASPELGAGIPDPFVLYAEKGEQGLRAALAELRMGSLRAIVREHRLDPAGRLAGNNDADKLRTVIVKAVVKAAR